MKRTPIRRVSKKRAGANRLYAKLRKEYLEMHPWCQIFLRRFSIDEPLVAYSNGAYSEVTPEGNVHWFKVPLATEIHHSRSPKKTYLNDTTTWFSACREQHEWIKLNQSQARLQGLLY